METRISIKTYAKLCVKLSKKPSDRELLDKEKKTYQALCKKRIKDLDEKIHAEIERLVV